MEGEGRESDLSVIRQRRGAANRLGFAVLLCYMRHPGVILGAGERPLASLLNLVATQLGVSPKCWVEHGRRDQTRWGHLIELQTVFGFRPFATRHHRPAVHGLDDLAWQTDKGIVLADVLVAELCRRSILLPSVNVIERIRAEAITRGTRRIYAALTEALTPERRSRLDALLDLREGGSISTLAWLCQPSGAPMPSYTLGEENRRIFASRYKLHLPSERELAEEIRRELCEVGRDRPAPES